MADKVSFVLYTKYHEQLKLLSDVQAGQLMKVIFAYEAGEDYEIIDPVVNMLWSIVKQQLDVDNQKYEETCTKRKEAGAKGGRSKTSKSEQTEAKQANAFFANQNEANQADYDSEYDSDYDSKTNNGDGGRRGRTRASADEGQPYVDNQEVSLEVRAAEAADNRPTHDQSVIQYGDYPTTEYELKQVQVLTGRLFEQYRSKAETRADVLRVFAMVHCREELANGTAIAVFDEQRAALLEYAFEQAHESGDTGWRYINGIYKRFSERGIQTVEDAYAYEHERSTGGQQQDIMAKFFEE